MITVHGRTRCQFYKGAPTGRDPRVKDAVSHPGHRQRRHLQTCDDAAAMLRLSGADAVMVGRGAHGRPWFPGRSRISRDRRAPGRSRRSPSSSRVLARALRGDALALRRRASACARAQAPRLVSRSRPAATASRRSAQLGRALLTADRSRAVLDACRALRRAFDWNGRRPSSVAA